jgi:hypothetical protein
MVSTWRRLKKKFQNFSKEAGKVKRIQELLGPISKNFFFSTNHRCRQISQSVLSSEKHLPPSLMLPGKAATLRVEYL